MAGTFNFSPGAKISGRLAQKWPRYKKKPQVWTLKNFFSKKSPRILNFWKKFLKTYIKRANLAETDISGHEIYLTGPSRAVCPPCWQGCRRGLWTCSRGSLMWTGRALFRAHVSPFKMILSDEEEIWYQNENWFSLFIGPESDRWLGLSLTNWLTHWLTHSCLVDLIDVILACEDANSKLVEVCYCC